MLRRSIEIAAVTLIATLASASPALAGICAPATPVPVVGLGIPAIAAFGFAYRRLRGRSGE